MIKLSKAIKQEKQTVGENEQPDDVKNVDGETLDAKNEQSPAFVLNERYMLNRQRQQDEEANILEKAPLFSVEWKSLRGMTQCSCGSPIDYLARKVNMYFI